MQDCEDKRKGEMEEERKRLSTRRMRGRKSMKMKRT